MNNASGGNIIYKFLGDTENLDKAVKGVKGTLSAVGKTASVLGTTVLAASTVAGAALVSITKKSVEAYAELEQLSDGAKKVFDEMDYSKVEQDAKNAYKTMNMSASEYLSVITQIGGAFSATMGDEKGYETAKKGLQAVADYASGMGKNVEELSGKFQKMSRSTGSYLSIADNFPEILPQTTKGFLEQAQAAGFLSDAYTQLNQVPVAEYQEALTNMLQLGVEKQNLAGNTFRESTETITGSIAAARSAIQNFLSGAGGFEEVVDTIVNAGTQIGKGVTEMLPKIVEGIVGIVNGLIPEIPKMIKTLLPTLINGIVDLMKGLSAATPEFISVIAEMLPFVLTSVVDMFVQLANDFAEQAPTIMPVIVDAIINTLVALFENIDVVIKACLALVLGLTNGIVQSLPVLLDRLPELVETVLNALIDLLPMLIEVGVEMIPPIVLGLIEATPQLINTFTDLFFKRLPKLIIDAIPRLWEAGKDIIIGVWEGIKSFDIVGYVKKLAKDVLAGFKNILGIHSPSTAFAYLGEMSMLGYTEQIESMKGILDDAIESTFSISPELTNGGLHYSPNVVVNNNITSNTDSLGQTVTNIKTFANGAKNDYNYGMGV